jgi:hypothetical protein
VLEDILEPKEVIIFKQPFDFEYNGSSFNELAMTNKRIVFYKRTGLIFKKDNTSSTPLKNINSVHFQEKGVIRKKGILEIDLGRGDPIGLEGNPSEIKYIYNKILSNL